MDYLESIAYLFGLQRFGIKLGLSNIKTLLNLIGNPHKRLRCIHIAGTNGKGSTALFLQSMLQQAGYRAGLFTSPHLIDVTERIRINDTEIQKQRVVQLVKEIRQMCKEAALDAITFFEFITAMAFKYFAEQQADPVIVEVGMGGRLDATNIIAPLLSIITSISLEHQMYLGNTLRQIAGEKAGIIKKNTPLVTGVTQPVVIELFAGICRAAGSPMYRLGKEIKSTKTGPMLFNYRGFSGILQGLNPGLIGDHQIRNATMALAAAELLREKGYIIHAAHMYQGIKQARWPGRMEVMRQNPTVLLDGAHNPEAWQVLRKSLKEYFSYKRLFMVIGVMQDKDIARMIEILTPEAHTVIFCKPKMERAATRELLGKHVSFSPSKRVLWIEDSARAVERALATASADDLICITGSLFTVGEAREYLLPGGSITSGRIPL